MVNVPAFLGRLSLLRIGVTAVVVFLLLAVLADRLLTSPPVRPSPHDVMALGYADPRVIVRDLQVSENVFTIAVVTDSSMQLLDRVPGNIHSVKTRGFITQRLLEVMPEIEGRPVRIELYLQSYGARAIDKAYQASYALSRRPDLLIYSVNPTFDFTPRWIMGGSAVPGALASYGGADLAHWTALLASPSEIIQGIAFRLLPGLSHRMETGRAFERLVSGLVPSELRHAPGPAVPSSLPPLQRRAAREGKLPVYDPERIPVSQFTHLLGMRYIDASPNGWGQQLLESVATQIDRAGVRAIIYTIPLRLEAIEDDAVARARFETLEPWLSSFAARRSTERLRILPRTLSRDVPDLDFFDTSHLIDAEPFVRFLREEIAISTGAR